MRSLTLAVVFIGALSLTHAQPAAFDFSFWPGKSARQDPRFLRMKEHPCGHVALARVTIVPSTQPTGALIAEEFVEVTPTGQPLRRWRVPVDSYPVALRGAQLLFRNGAAIYRVDPQGRITRHPGPAPIPPSPYASCRAPANPSTREDHACQTITDLPTGRNRIIRFQPPCT